MSQCGCIGYCLPMGDPAFAKHIVTQLTSCTLWRCSTGPAVHGLKVMLKFPSPLSKGDLMEILQVLVHISTLPAISSSMHLLLKQKNKAGTHDWDGAMPWPSTAHSQLAPLRLPVARTSAWASTLLAMERVSRRSA